jgi:alpha-glucosidase
MSGTAEAPWWQRGVIYQIYPRSYQDSGSDGIGDLAGIASRLEHPAWLGVDAVWLSPIFASPMEDGGYDVSDYTDVDPMFGTLDDFDVMVARAHDLGLRVVLDFVPNHTSHRHPWFVESRSSRDAGRRDWYIWRDSAPDGGPPTNWRCVSDDRAGSAWNFDDATGQWFLATFSRVQPDLNWANPDVRAAMADVLRFWLERGVDGFRIDMVSFLAKDQQFRNEPKPTDGGTFEYGRDAVYHFNRPETVEYLVELRRAVDDYPDRLLIGEMLYESSIEMLVEYAERAGIDMPTNFSLITLPFEPGTIGAFVDAYDRATADRDVWPNWCLSNHDMPRPTRYGRDGAGLALVLLLTVRGTPFVYYGDEIGMSNVEVPPERRDDRWSVTIGGISRDSFRTPMQWDAGPNAGFCPPDVEPWLPVADDHDRINLVAERDDPASTLHLVRRLIELRRELPALAIGTYRRLHDVPDDCLAYRRTDDDGGQVTVVCNFGSDARTVALDPDRGGQLPPRVLVETGAVDLDPTSPKVTLGPRAAVVVG